MKTKKRLLVTLLCVLILVCLAGCESREIKQAKEYIDLIYEEFMYKIDFYEESIRLMGEETSLVRQLVLNYEFLKAYKELLLDIYRDLSPEEKQLLEDYASENYDGDLEWLLRNYSPSYKKSK